jgi:uncharacterized protein (DUF1501 family)
MHDELTRRHFMARTAQACFGLTIGGAAADFFAPGAIAAAPAPTATGGGQAKSVIYIFLSGGMSHLDTLDPKPDAPSEIRGPVKALSTNVDGIQLGECFTHLSKQADKIAFVRSMTSTQGAHGPGRYFMRTGYAERASIVHPSAGSWVAKLAGRANPTLPPFVTVNTGNGHPGAGFFEPDVAPLPIKDAASGLRDVQRLKTVSEAEFNRQLALRKLLDREFDAKFHEGQKNVRAYNQVFEEAVRLMNSKDLEAFDLGRESQATHDLYGTENFSKGLLLARRLVERGVRYVDVELGGFDWHNDAFTNMENKIPVVDQALSALLRDLDETGLLDSTLVVLATEFGRTPKITGTAGRNHYPKAFSYLLAGGGIRGGQVYGKTDKTGSTVIENKVTGPDLNATIGHAMGVEFDKVLMSPSRRPFKLAGREGKPVTQLFG